MPSAQRLTDKVFGIPTDLPKPWAKIAHVSLDDDSLPSATELRDFLLEELAQTLSTDVGAISESIGLEDLGVSSLSSLRLSQRL
eukprot:SAG31_NODE_36439_length_313_cov_0.957944_1_plen_83_part_10